MYDDVISFSATRESQNIRKIGKIAKTSEENFYIFNINIFITFPGKMSLLIISKVTNNQGFTLSLENTICEKPPLGGQTDSQRFEGSSYVSFVI